MYRTLYSLTYWVKYHKCWLVLCVYTGKQKFLVFFLLMVQVE